MNPIPALPGEEQARDEETDISATDGPEIAQRTRFLRRRSWICRVLLVPFLLACLGSIFLYSVYHSSTINVMVYYFTVRPALLWFGMLAPFLALGVFAFRWRWFLLGFVLWFAAFCGSYEVLQCVKPFPGGARAKFEERRQAFFSFLDGSEGRHQRLDAPLRIVTWNVLAGKRMGEGGLDQLAALDPDIVFFQEYAWTPKLGVADPREHPHFARYHLLAGRQAVLSRFPIERVPNRILKPWLGSAYRVEISPGIHLMCVNVHLSTTDLRTQIIRGWTREELRDAIELAEYELGQVRKLVETCRSEGATIVAGDFNLPADYVGMSVLKEDMQDCFEANGYGWGKTVRAPLIVVRIDLVFVPDTADVRYAASVPTPYSDHYMTIAEVVLPVEVQARAGAGAVAE